MASEKSSTTIYIGNLTTKSRLIELKASLLKLLQKSLKIHVTSNDISIINGTKRYALVDVHNEQNVDYLLETLSDGEDRKKIKFNFDQIVEPGNWLYVDKVKSNDDKQARDDFENAKNPKPFQKPHLHTRKRPEYDVVVPLRPTTNSKSYRAGSRLSSSSLKSQSRLTPKSLPSTDLDVTLPESHSHSGAHKEPQSSAHEESGEVMHKRIDMIPLADSTLKTHEDSDDSGTQMDSVHNQTLSSIHGDGDDYETSPHHSDYEDPPGSVIDMRHSSRSSIQGKITPRIHRRTGS
ncbi:uncharacterized protein LOC132733122 isoform X2 [Ruditapes philippinarum]|uniref:uncharacterized protein LOC132733122 isoform X2 n=1 Tax=Ruditapes philippinarum TaxID=129788 RepID=UPI00295AFE4A|nr:uncharacterized protein LOC132733122 isoform X2 [Ruditapes philippinarum]